MLYDKIKKDIIIAVKAKDKDSANLLKVLVSDIQRDPNKDYSDDKVIKVVTQTVKVLYDNHDKYHSDKDLIDAEYLERVYLPTQISIDEIIAFLETVDFDKLKSKMQATGLAMKHFPKGSVNGGAISQIINDMF